MHFSYKPCLILAAAICLIISPRVQAAETGWQLDQVGCYTGQTITRTSKFGFSMEAVRFGLKYLILPPDWKCNLVNPKGKIFLKMSGKDMAEHVIFNADRPKEAAKKKTPVLDGNEKIAGRNTTRYKIVGEGTTVFWVTNEIKYPPGVIELIARQLGVPENIGTPLRVVRLDREGKKRVLLDTIKTRQVAMTKGMFRIPPDYTRATDEIEVLMSSGESDDETGDLTELLKNL